MSNILIPVFVLLFFVFLFFYIKLRHRRRRSSYQEDDFSYMPYEQKNILTKNEYAFYLELKKLMDKKKYLICPKVRLADLFDVTDRKEFMRYFGKINRKHIDFLICDQDLYPLFAIELDDKSHLREDRMRSDQFKDALFEACSMDLVRIPAAMKYEAKALKDYF